VSKKYREDFGFLTNENSCGNMNFRELPVHDTCQNTTLFIRYADRDGFVFIKKFHNVLPPEGATGTSDLWWCLLIAVKVIPGEMYPWQISMTIEIVHVLEEKCSVLCF
jgi:hypothetical protein